MPARPPWRRWPYPRRFVPVPSRCRCACTGKAVPPPVLPGEGTRFPGWSRPCTRTHRTHSQPWAYPPYQATVTGIVLSSLSVTVPPVILPVSSAVRAMLEIATPQSFRIRLKFSIAAGSVISNSRLSIFSMARHLLSLGLVVQVDAGNLVLVHVGNAHVAVAELVSIGVLVHGRLHNLGGHVLLKLNHGGLVDDHKVDVAAGGRVLDVAASLLAGGSAVILGNGSVEAALGYQGDVRKAGQNLPALGGVHILHHAIQGGGNEQVAIFVRHLVLVHHVGALAQCGNHGGTVSQGGGGGHLGNAGSGCISREPEGVQLGNNFGADELASQAAKGDTGSLQVVHVVYGEHPATVEVALHGLVGQGDVTRHISAVPAICAQALHAQLGDDQLVGVCALAGQIGSTVQLGGQGRILVNLIQNGDELLCKGDRICHSALLPFLFGFQTGCDADGVFCIGILVPPAIRAGPVGIGGWGLGFKQISVVLFKRFQCGPDICLLVLAGAECVNIQQGGNRLCVAALGGGNGVPDASIKGHAIELVLPLSVLVGKLAGQLLDFALELVDVHALERLKPIFGGLELLFHGFIVREGLFSGFDIAAILVHDGVDDLFRQGLVSNLKILQKFAFHGMFSSRYALISGVASPALPVLYALGRANGYEKCAAPEGATHLSFSCLGTDRHRLAVLPVRNHYIHRSAEVRTLFRR
nr:MAG TPA: hypothetical protein [Caudoviricetes sp.]